MFMQYLKRRNRGMKIKKFALAVGCMVLLCGCTKSNIVESQMAQPMEPDTAMYWDIELDLEQLKEQVKDIYLEEQGDYPMAADIDFEVNLPEEYVDVTVVVKDGTSPEEAAEYAMSVIKGINDEVTVQDATYGESGEDTYGGLYQENEIRVKIYDESTYRANGVPMYEAVIPADEYQVIVIK